MVTTPRKLNVFNGELLLSWSVRKWLTCHRQGRVWMTR